MALAAPMAPVLPLLLLLLALSGSARGEGGEEGELGDDVDITELVEGKVESVEGTGGFSLYKFEVYDPAAPVVLYDGSTGNRLMYACFDDYTLCRSGNARQDIMPNAKTEIDTESLQVTFPGYIYLYVNANIGATVKLVMFNSFETVEGVKLTFDGSDGYDLDENDDYRYFHTYVCPHSSSYLKFTGDNGKVYGAENGHPKSDTSSYTSICDPDSSSDNVCQKNNPEPKTMYNFSIKVKDEKKPYWVMSQTKDVEELTLETVKDTIVSPFESCALTEHMDLSSDQRASESLIIVTWSKNTGVSEQVSIAASENFLDTKVTPLVSGENYIELASVNGLSGLYVELKTRTSYTPLADINDTIDIGVIASHDIIQVHTKTPYYVSSVADTIGKNIKNTYISFPEQIARPYNGEALNNPYDIIYAVEIASTNKAPVTNKYSVFLDFDKLDRTPSSEHDYVASEVTAVGNVENLSETGYYLTQGIIEQTEDLKFEGKLPFMTVVKTEGDDDLSQYYSMVTLTASTRFENDETYQFPVHKDIDTFFSFEVTTAKTQNLEIEVSTKNISLSDDNVTLQLTCSQVLYVGNNTSLTDINISIRQRKLFVNLADEMAVSTLEEGKRMYCSFFYKNINSDSENKITVQFTSHTTHDYVHIYEGSPKLQDIDVTLNEETNYNEGKTYKIVGDSLIKEGGEIDDKAPEYDLLFVKVQLLGLGPRNSDGTVPDTIAEDQTLVFCLADSPYQNCVDTETKRWYPDYGGVYSDEPIAILDDAGIDLEHESGDMANEKYNPLSTYVIVDTSQITAGYAVEYIITVGYGFKKEYDETQLVSIYMHENMDLYYNNNNSETVDNHVQFIKLNLSKGLLFQLSLNVFGAEDGETPEYTTVFAIMCTDYPELDVFDIEDGLSSNDNHICYKSSISVTNDNTITLYGDNSSTHYWYVSLIPVFMSKEYKGGSNIDMKFERIITVNDIMITVPFTNTNQLVYPIAYNFGNASHYFGNSLLSFKLVLSSSVKSTVACFTGSTPYETEECLYTETVQGAGTHYIQTPLTAELFGAEYPGDVNGLYYSFLTFTGPEDYSSINPGESNTLEFKIKKSMQINGLSTESVIMTASEAGETPTSDPLLFYFFQKNNELMDNIYKLIMVIEPPKVGGANAEPDFYKNSRIQMEFFPNRNDVEPTETNENWKEVEQGYIVYPIGQELERRSYEDISKGIAVKLTFLYDTFVAPEAGNTGFKLRLGLYYDDSTNEKSITKIIQLTPSYSEIFKTDSNTVLTNDEVLPNYFRIAPNIEKTNAYKDITGAVVIPCKGTPTIYFTYENDTNTPFPGKDTNDEVMQFPVLDNSYTPPDERRNRRYSVLAEEVLNKYINVNFSQNSINTKSTEYSYRVITDYDMICMPEKKLSEEISILSTYIVDGTPYIVIGYSPLNIPEDCKTKYGQNVVLKYSMFYYALNSTTPISKVEDIEDYEVQPTVCGFQDYGKPAVVDSNGRPVWSDPEYEIQDQAAKMRSNAAFRLTDANGNPITYVFNILGKIDGVQLSEYVSFSYGGLIVSGSNFNSQEDGGVSKSYTSTTDVQTLALSPAVVENSQGVASYYSSEYYFMVEVAKLNNIQNMNIAFCINEGEGRCISDSSRPDLWKQFTAPDKAKDYLLFKLNDSENGTLTHYSSMFGPNAILESEQSVDLKVFGTSVINLFSNSSLSETDSNDMHIKIFRKVYNDVANGYKTMSYGYMDFSQAENIGYQMSLPSITLKAEFDKNYKNNSKYISSGASSFGAAMFICSDFPLTDPEQAGTGSNLELGENCVFIKNISISTSSGSSKSSESVTVDIPFGYNRGKGTNSMTINGKTSSFDNVKNKFNVSESSMYFIGFVTSNVLSGFEWTVTTHVQYPINISTPASSLETVPFMVTTPLISSTNIVYSTIENDDSDEKIGNDKCALSIYPRSEQSLDYIVFVCASSSIQFPSINSSDCDIISKTVDDPRVTVSFPCRNPNHSSANTFFGFEFLSIENESKVQFDIEVIRSKQFSSMDTRTISYKDIMNITLSDNKYYCGQNPKIDLSALASSDLLPVECYSEHSFLQDISNIKDRNNLEAVEFAIIPDASCTSCYDDHTVPNTSGKTDNISVMKTVISTENDVLCTKYYPENSSISTDVGNQVLRADDLNSNKGKKVSSIAVAISLNTYTVQDVANIYSNIMSKSFKISVMPIYKNNSDSTSVLALNDTWDAATTQRLSSSELGKNEPSYITMHMTTNALNKSVITISPCYGSPTVYGTPFDMYPSSSNAAYTYVSSNGNEFDIIVNPQEMAQPIDDTTWFFNILTTTDSSLKYDVYPNNNYLRPANYDRTIKVVEPTNDEFGNNKVKFAVEFTAFEIPEDVAILDSNIEIHYKLYAFENEYTSNTPLTACAAEANGVSIFVNIDTGKDYLSLSRSKNTGKLRILGNKGGINLGNYKYVTVVGEYTLPNGTLLQSSSNYANIKIYSNSSIPWWGILILVFLIIILVGGVVAAVIVLLRHRKKQGEFLLTAENDVEDNEYVANFDTMN